MFVYIGWGISSGGIMSRGFCLRGLCPGFARQASTRFTYPGLMKGWVDVGVDSRGGVIYRDGLPVCKQSVTHPTSDHLIATRPGVELTAFFSIYLFILFINQQWHRSTSKEHTGRMANTGLTNHLCAAKKINKRLHFNRKPSVLSVTPSSHHCRFYLLT